MGQMGSRVIHIFFYLSNIKLMHEVEQFGHQNHPEKKLAKKSLVPEISGFSCLIFENWQLRKLGFWCLGVSYFFESSKILHVFLWSLTWYMCSLGLGGGAR